MILQTGNVQPQQSFGSRPVAGGSFTPNTLEAAFVLRSNLDYQFEKAFIDKHRAQMQNRLNEVSKRLEEAYKDLLNVSMSQQIGENADRNLRADVRLDGRDGTAAAETISGVMEENAFEDLGIDPSTQNSQNYTTFANRGTNIWRAPGKTADLLSANGLYGDDGNLGYGRSIGFSAVQFRTLTERTTAAGNIAGNMDITLRVEDDPPTPQELDGNLDLLNSVTSAILGGPPPPTYFNQTVSQYSASYSTGGFWSAVNYLYNFSPREIKYSYAVGYTVNSNEAGDDDYLLNGELVSRRDIPNNSFNNDGSDAGFDPQGYLKKDNRVKWNSLNPIEGYQHERSGTSNNYPTVINRKKAWLDEGGTNLNWDLDENNVAVDGVVDIVENLIFQSGTYTYNGTFVNETGGIGTAIAGTVNDGGKIVQDRATNRAKGLVSLLDSNIELGSVFRYDVDMTEDATEDDVTEGSANSEFQVNDRGAIRSSLFFNHYEVETRTVEFNNKDNIDLPELTSAPTNDISDDAAGQLYVRGSIARSKSIDASKNYDLVADDPINNPDTKEISRTAGNVSSSFNGEFLQSLHKIESVNGQDVVGNENKQASPILGGFEIGRYEGLERSVQMNRNIVEYKPPSDTEVDAANTVPTDWYQGELLTNTGEDPTDPDFGGVWFPHVDDTLYAAEDADGYGRLNAPRQLMQARNSFTLKQDEFLDLLPAANWETDAAGITRPTYQRKDIAVDVQLTGIHLPGAAALDGNPAAYNPNVAGNPKIFINGREYEGVPVAINHQAPAPDVADVTFRVVLSSSDPVNESFLQEGENTIVVQASDGEFFNSATYDNFTEGIRVTATAAADYPSAVPDQAGAAATTNLAVPAAADFAEVQDMLNSKVITGYANVNGVGPDVKYASELNRPGKLKALSRWQTRLVPVTAELDSNNKLVQMASTQESTGSSFKSTNAFVDMIIEMLNERKYRDIFKLGLVSNLNKLALNGQAQLPSGSSMQGSISMFYDMQQQAMVVTQDKLIAQSRAAG